MFGKEDLKLFWFTDTVLSIEEPKESIKIVVRNIK